MPVRLLTLDELPGIVDDGEIAFNEYHAETYGLFNREHWLHTWTMLLQFGEGLVFMEYQGDDDRAVFGAIRTQNLFTGGIEYVGSFTVVRPQYRGARVVFSLMDGVHEIIQSFGEPCLIHLSSRLPALEKAWVTMGYEEDSHRYTRRVEP